MIGYTTSRYWRNFTHITIFFSIIYSTNTSIISHTSTGSFLDNSHTYIGYISTKTQNTYFKTFFSSRHNFKNVFNSRTGLIPLCNTLIRHNTPLIDIRRTTVIWFFNFIKRYIFITISSSIILYNKCIISLLICCLNKSFVRQLCCRDSPCCRVSQSPQVRFSSSVNGVVNSLFTGFVHKFRPELGQSTHYEHLISEVAQNTIDNPWILGDAANPNSFKVRARMCFRSCLQTLSLSSSKHPRK